MLTIVGGTACVGPERGRESVFVATRDWIGEPQVRDREWSMAELARRYFAAFAPAGDRDFAFWSGLPLTDCRAAIRKVGAGIVPVGRDRRGETMLAPRGWKARRDRVAAPRLLGSYDTLLMGYAQRDHALDPKHAKTVLPGGGILRPTILRAGRFVGTWSSRKTGKKLAYELAPFARLKTDEREALGREARDVARFEGLEKAVAAR